MPQMGNFERERMGKGKLLTMAEAVSELVRDGMSIAMGTSLEGLIPFAAGHEIIRRKKKDLTLIGPISDILFDQMIGAGCVSRIRAAWVGNVSTGMGYHFQRAVEEGVPNQVTVEENSNFSVALGLHAQALGIPFMPTYTLLGSDISKDHPGMEPLRCPYTGDTLLAIRAIEPDLAILHAQRSDPEGNTHLWGNMGISVDAAKAAKQVLIVAEEVVEEAVIRSDPNRTVIPGFMVTAVVECPWGAHPSAVQGYYGHDDPYYVDYARETRSPEGSKGWYEKWVYGVRNRAQYLGLLGPERQVGLRVTHPAPAAVADFGY
jgi:glutaconate CoA-transferase subunit A